MYVTSSLFKTSFLSVFNTVFSIYFLHMQVTWDSSTTNYPYLSATKMAGYDLTCREWRLKGKSWSVSLRRDGSDRHPWQISIAHARSPGASAPPLCHFEVPVKTHLLLSASDLQVGACDRMIRMATPPFLPKQLQGKKRASRISFGKVFSGISRRGQENAATAHSSQSESFSSELRESFPYIHYRPRWNIYHDIYIALQR